MKPEKALELVHRYAAISAGIRSASKKIAASIEGCKGVSGQRNADGTTWSPGATVDEKGRELDLHLTNWYQPHYDHQGEGDPVFEKITIDEHGEICAHCYSAHLAVQERKALRKAMQNVRGAMSRSIAAKDQA